jgi:hypothetical protein
MIENEKNKVSFNNIFSHILEMGETIKVVQKNLPAFSGIITDCKMS